MALKTAPPKWKAVMNHRTPRSGTRVPNSHRIATQTEQLMGRQQGPCTANESVSATSLYDGLAVRCARSSTDCKSVVPALRRTTVPSYPLFDGLQVRRTSQDSSASRCFAALVIADDTSCCAASDVARRSASGVATRSVAPHCEATSRPSVRSRRLAGKGSLRVLRRELLRSLE